MLTSASVALFGDALGGVESNASLHDDPAAWLDSNAHQIRAAATELLALSSDDLTGLEGLLFPRLTAYTLACVTFHTRDSSLLITLREKISQWISMEPITKLTSRKSIEEALLDIINECLGENSGQSSQIEKILRCDIDSIAAQILMMLSDDQHRRQLVKQKNEDAQTLLDLFQELLNLAHLGPIRSRVLTTMLVLSKRSSLYPASLILQGVERQGDSPVAGGSFGDVWMGRMDEKNVAIKVIRYLDSSAKARVHEAVLWKQLSHPNVLPFYGVYTWPQGSRSALCLVSPWTEHGNVVEYLRKAPNTDRTSLLLDIARGLEYLHTFDPPVIHGDLKGTNILVMPSLRACIADFGLCTLTQHAGVRYTSSSSLGAGALLYRAPELLNRSEDERKHGGGNEYGEWMTLASDVYSFGCICYELFTGRPRFHNLGIFDAIMAVRENRSLNKPIAMDDMLWELIQMCWRVDPTLRPTASDIVEHLKSQLEAGKQGSSCVPEWNDEVAPCATIRVPSPMSTIAPHQESYETITDNESSELHPNIETNSLSSPGGSSELPLVMPQDAHHQTELTSNHNNASSLTLLPDDKSWTVAKGDILIAVMGPSGTGKSSFIKYAMPSAAVVVSHELESCTQEVRAFGCLHPNGSGRKIVLIDTPGFDDTDRTDYDILRSITQWLKVTYEGHVTLSGILYFHSIADNRMKGNPRKNLEMFQYLCGDAALGNVILTTTHWDRIPENIASKREAELKSLFWKPFIDKGSHVARFDPSTFDIAWSIINRFSASPHRPLKVQIEMVDEGKELHETAAFRFLVQWWKSLVKRLNGMMRKSQSAISEKELQRAIKENKTLEDNRSHRPARTRFFPLRRYSTPKA